MLGCHHAACVETAAIANTLDLIDDRNCRIARSHEIAMQGMNMAVFIDGALCRHQSLTDHLSTKHALPARLRTATTKQIVLKRFNVENIQKIPHGLAHIA